MCSSPKMPKMKDPEPIPAPEPLPTPRQPQAAPVVQPPPAYEAPPPAPIAPSNEPTPQTPPPLSVTANSAEAEPIIKRKKSKRKELQQASSGTDALRIPLDKSIGSTPSGSTGSSGLNIPR